VPDCSHGLRMRSPLAKGLFAGIENRMGEQEVAAITGRDCLDRAAERKGFVK